MGLVTEYVTVSLNSSSIPYYENLGYDIPRRIDKYGCLRVQQGQTICVKTVDLPRCSHYPVEVECDICKQHYTMRYAAYYTRNHNGLIYCLHCAPTILISGNNSIHWNDNLTEEDRLKCRGTLEYNILIRTVLARDKSICYICKASGKTVHHLNSYDWCIDGRYDAQNCLCLCEQCHKNFHTIYGYGNNTKEQFEEWAKQIVYIEAYEKPILPQKKVYCFEDKKVYDGTFEIYPNSPSNRRKINACCNKKAKSYKGKHYLWAEEYLKMSNKEIQDYLQWCNSINYKDTKGHLSPNAKSVICLTTNKTFLCIKYAEEEYNLHIGKSKIGEACRGFKKTVGKLPDGTPLRWMYLSDFENLSKEEQEKILQKEGEIYDNSRNVFDS